MLAKPLRLLALTAIAACCLADDLGAALVAHWQFDETTGLTADDAVGANDGALLNFPGDDSQWQAGVINNALRFDGVDDFITHAFTLPRSQGTIAHWLNPDVVGADEHAVTVYESNSPATGQLFDGFGDPGMILEIHSGVEDEWQARYQDGDSTDNNAAGGGRFAVSEGIAVANTWTHVAMTWNISGDLVLFVNCQEVGRQSMTAGEFDGLTTTERFIGRPSANTRFWDGLIDDVRIYDTALTQPEIEAAAQFCPQAAPTTASEIPTLSGRWLALLGVTLGAFGWLVLARRG